MKLAPELLPSFRGVVEQSLPDEQLEALERSELEALGGAVPLPVFSVAQSTAKRGIEAHWIAESVVRSIRELAARGGLRRRARRWSSATA